jgi:hypothetical protein
MMGALIGDGDEVSHLWQQVLHQPAVHHQPHGDEGALVHQHAGDFFALAFRADPQDIRSLGLHGFPSVKLDFQIEAGGEANGSKKAQRIFLKALGRISYAPKDFITKITHSFHVIDDVPLGGHVQGVDGEVAPGGILLDGPKYDRLWPSTVHVDANLAEGGDIDGLIAHGDQANAESCAYQLSPRKCLLNLLRSSRGCNIQILGGKAEEVVPNASPDQEGLMASGPQFRNDRECCAYVLHGRTSSLVG